MRLSTSALAVSSLGLWLCAFLGTAACSSSSGSSASPGVDSGGGGDDGGGGADAAGDSTTGTTDSGTTPGDTGTTGPTDARAEGQGPTTSDGGLPSGWLYTSGAKIYDSNGARGHAVDGPRASTSMTSSSAATTTRSG